MPRPLVLLLLFVLSALVTAASAQPVDVAGRVLDAETGDALPGATVVAAGTTAGTATDRDGRFALTLDAAPPALVVSFVGYAAETVVLAGRPLDALEIRLRPSLLDLQPVVVSASRHAQARADAPVAIAALSAADLRATRPVLLADALNRLPGVHVVDLGNEQHAMSIRQPMSYKALYAYLEDGVPVRPVGLFNHNALAEVNMEGVDRVEVVRGPASALYGSGAIGGAVNVLTPTPSVVPTSSAALRGSAYGYGRLDASASATTGRLGLWAGGYAARQRDGRRAHTDYDKRSLTLRADLALGGATRLVTTFSTNHLDTDTDGALDSTTYFGPRTAGDDVLPSLQTFTYRTVDATRLTTRLNHVWSPRSRSSVALFARDNAVGQLPHYRIRRLPGDPSAAWGEENRQAFRSLGLDAQHEALLGPARLTVGATLDRSPVTYRAHYLAITRDAASGRFTGYARRDSLLADYAVDLSNTAAYARLAATPLAGLQVSAALRYDRIGYGFDNHLPPSAYSGAPDGTATFDALSPHVGLTYSFTSARGLYASASRGFVPPEVSELYGGVRTPTLRPAHFASYEAGGWASFLGNTLQLDVAAYRMEGTDEIISVRLPDDSQVNQNAGATRHVGVEYAATYQPSTALTLRFGGTNARHTFVRHEERGVTLDGRAMPAAPGWIAHAEVAVRPPLLRAARVALEWQHVGAYGMDVAGTQRYPGHDLLNLRTSYRLAGAEVWAQVLNLTDALYATTASRGAFGASYTPGAPRTVVVGVAYTLGR